jgi:membrane-bound serine protease (ClpP class)
MRAASAERREKVHVQYLDHVNARLRAARVLLVLSLFAEVVCGVARAEERPEAYVVKIKGGISEAYTEAVERKLEYARQQGVRTVILELDTPGGYLQDSMDLADYIFQLKDIDVVAYVHPDAYSGGTMVALACKEIYIDAAVGMMGDVAPVNQAGEIVGEKSQTVVREKLTSFARARGYPMALAEAMVTKELEVYRIQLQSEPEGSYHYVTGAHLDSMTDEERAKIVNRKLIVPAGQLLTMDAHDAVEYGFARKAVESPQELYKVLGLDPQRVERLYLTASERLLTIVDMFSPLLIAAGLVLLFIEMTHPGVWLPGALGVACFVTFFIVKYSLHYARMLEVILFLIGLALLLLEILFLPGHGVLAIVGVALMFISLVLAFQGFTIPRTAGQTLVFEYSVLKVTGSFAAAGVAILLLAHYLPSLPILSRIVHRYDLAAAHVGDLGEAHMPGLSAMVGQVGVAATPLRPAGRAEFGDRTLDVVTEGDFVEKGARVQIREMHGSRIVVTLYRET